MAADQQPARTGPGKLRLPSQYLWGGALILGSSLCFGSVVVLGKLALSDQLPVLPVLGIRYAVSAILLLLIGAASGRRLMLPARAGSRLVVLGLTGDALSAWLFFAALTMGSVPIVSILFFTYPILVMLISPQGARTRPMFAGLASALAGVSVMLGSGHALAISRLGVLATLAAAVVYAGFLVGTDRAVRDVSPLAGSLWLSTGTSLGLWACAGASQTLQLPTGPRQWIIVVAMGAGTAASVIFFILGLGLLGALRTSILGASEPLATTVLAIIFLHEKLSLFVAIGGAFVVAGAVAAMLSKGSPSPQPVTSPACATGQLPSAGHEPSHGERH